MTKTLAGKVALVTGGSRGIGAASARALADEGANVAISYVASADKAQAVVNELKAKGVEARAFKADQASSSEVDQLVKDVAKHFGRLDILINNAAVAISGAVDDANADTAALTRQDAINVHGVVAAIRAASKLMGDGGRIVTIGSGIATRASFPGLADYAATKAAVVGYSKGAARDLGPRGITVNGWLKAKHHFSFGSHYDPANMGHGALRVWNDDEIAPNSGFPAHPHANMEIITYVREGAITHQDSLGNKGRTEAGDVQVMSAGSGIRHSEYNLENAKTKIFQIWIEPTTKGGQPTWGAKPFPKSDRSGKLVTIASGIAGDKDALPIRADARVLATTLKAGGSAEYEPP